MEMKRTLLPFALMALTLLVSVGALIALPRGPTHGAATRLSYKPRPFLSPLLTGVRANHVAPTTCLRYSTRMDILTTILNTDVGFGEVMRGR
jgi:hypothetical protein